ncbi:MAG TPA: YbdD/YjiX family protein [Pengzhenrongella sp.]
MRTFSRPGGVARAVVRVVRRVGLGVRWYVTTLLGDHDYVRYVEHLARVHPGAEPESVRDYWCSRHAVAEVQARCC